MEEVALSLLARPLGATVVVVDVGWSIAIKQKKTGAAKTPSFVQSLLASTLLAADLNRYDDAMSIAVHDAMLNPAIAAIGIGRIPVAVSKGAQS
jgi:hypothetical protein